MQKNRPDARKGRCLEKYEKGTCGYRSVGGHYAWLGDVENRIAHAEAKRFKRNVRIPSLECPREIFELLGTLE
ncbi:hypothetical protein C4568_00390 [Candidatus Parcubacteria bacterium]|nr:MAG: hypothetical protein C4568_00390 [Candidatus Parcubacteria bacterium]